MLDPVEAEFLWRALPYLKNHRQSGDKHMADCPYCGETKRRFAFFPGKKDGKTRFRCVKCNVTGSFSWYLRDPRNPLRDTSLADEMSFAAFGGTPAKVEHGPVSSAESADLLGDLFSGGSDVPDEDSPLEVPTVESSPISEFVRATEDPESKRYLRERMIDLDDPRVRDVWFSPDFGSWANRNCPGDTKMVEGESRIVFPIREPGGRAFGASGRATGKSRLRYAITHFSESDHPSCVGAAALEGGDVWVCEGAFDSLLLDNCVAALNADLGTFAAKAGYDRRTTVLCFDNEPGSRFIREALGRAVDDGWAVAFWRRPAFDVGKDVNEAVMRGHSPRELFDVAGGLGAKLKFARWCGKLR